MNLWCFPGPLRSFLGPLWCFSGSLRSHAVPCGVYSYRHHSQHSVFICCHHLSTSCVLLSESTNCCLWDTARYLWNRRPWSSRDPFPHHHILLILLSSITYILTCIAYYLTYFFTVSVTAITVHATLPLSSTPYSSSITCSLIHTRLGMIIHGNANSRFRIGNSRDPFNSRLLTD